MLISLEIYLLNLIILKGLHQVGLFSIHNTLDVCLGDFTHLSSVNIHYGLRNGYELIKKSSEKFTHRFN